MTTVRRLFDIPYRQKELFPTSESLTGKVDGKWRSWSSAELVSRAEEFALGLIDMGLNRGDTIGVISANRPEWNISDIGMLR